MDRIELTKSTEQYEQHGFINTYKLIEHGNCVRESTCYRRTDWKNKLKRNLQENSKY
jgi:hypothetical protein